MMRFLASPLFLLGIGAGVLLEAVVLVVVRRVMRRGPDVWDTLSFLGAGVAFVAALLIARTQQEPDGSFVVALTAALVFHVWHLARLSASAHRRSCE
jgi:hypothetical protein